MPKISVIIPIYNTQNYLEKCLDSVINQTFKDIEIICVNDCSKDNSLEILKKYSKKDKRIKIIDFIENKGPASARNEALNIAKGEYIAFIDSDDWIDLDFYEKLYNKAIKTKADIIKGANLQGYYNDKYINYPDLNSKIPKNKYEFNKQYTSAIYKLEFLEKNSIKFPTDLIFHEDPYFILLAIYYSKNIVIENTAQYHVLIRDNSLSRNIKVKQIKDFILYVEKIMNFFKSKLNNKDYSFILNMLYKQIFAFRELHTKKDDKYYNELTKLYIEILLQYKKIIQ